MAVCYEDKDKIEKKEIESVEQNGVDVDLDKKIEKKQKENEIKTDIDPNNIINSNESYEDPKKFLKIFVGGLPFASHDSVLYAYFRNFGPILEAVIIRDRRTGASKGYGFVTMENKEDARKAVKDSSPFIDGRKCNVNYAFIGAKSKIYDPNYPYYDRYAMNDGIPRYEYYQPFPSDWNYPPNHMPIDQYRGMMNPIMIQPFNYVYYSPLSSSYKNNQQNSRRYFPYVYQYACPVPVGQCNPVFGYNYDYYYQPFVPGYSPKAYDDDRRYKDKKQKKSHSKSNDSSPRNSNQPSKSDDYNAKSTQNQPESNSTKHNTDVPNTS